MEKKFELGPLQKMWIEQLRKHQEQQMSGQLGEIRETESHFCCLGKLHACYHEMNGIPLPVQETLLHDFIASEGMGSDSTLQRSYDKYGLRNSVGWIVNPFVKGKKIFESLAAMNDHGLTWPEIADYVEANPENVFTKSV